MPLWVAVVGVPQVLYVYELARVSVPLVLELTRFRGRWTR
jgi:hypothetical protein